MKLPRAARRKKRKKALLEKKNNELKQRIVKFTEASKTKRKIVTETKMSKTKMTKEKVTKTKITNYRTLLYIFICILNRSRE